MSEKKASQLARVKIQKYWSVEDAHVIVDAWKESGLSMEAFARNHAIHAHRLARWVRQLRKAESEQTPQFHPVRVVNAQPQESASEARIEVVLAGGVVVRLPSGFAGEDLRQVLDVLETRTSC